MRLLLVALLCGCGSSPATPKCDGHADCPGGRCVHGKCKAGSGGDGSSCEYSIECASDYCVEGVCRSGQIGAECTADYHCDSRYCNGRRCATDNIGTDCGFSGDGDCRGAGVKCIKRKCQPLGASKAACDHDDDCLAGLACIDGLCLTADDQRLRDAEIAEAKRRATQKADADMLSQSGVAPDPSQAEKTVHPAGRGQRVRTVKVTAKGHVFAACRADERLVGGGCSDVVASYPSEFSTEDTVGARWNCEATTIKVTAYALCMKLP